MPTVTDTISVLVIEDEESFVEALVVGLKREGFVVTVARDGPEGLEQFERVRPDMILLDLWLPKKSGIDVCREIRARSRVPIIMVTAKSSEIDTVVGLEVGADDYVTKPFVLGELVARIRAVARRHGAAGARQLRVGTLRVDLGAMRAERDGHALDLTRREMDLLVYFVRNAGRVLARDQILNHVWGYDSDVGDGVIDVYVSYLRRKLEAFGPRMLETVWGLGYRLNDDAP